MQILSQPLPLILWILLAGLHFAVPLLPRRIGIVLRYTNICLHIGLYFVCMLCRIPQEEVVLLFLLSLLAYVLSALLWQRTSRRASIEAVTAKEEEDMQ